MFLPLLFKDGMPCLIVGGGQVASRKVETLAEMSCSITVVAPYITDLIAQAAQRETVRWLEREYVLGDCKGFQLAIAATPRREVNRQVSDEARGLGIPVNVVDDRELSTVIFPAVWREGPLLLAVSTEGVAPFMAVAIRNRLARYAGRMGRWVEIGGRFREVVRNEIKDPAERRKLYKRFLDAGQPSDFGSSPDSTRLSDWLSWLNHIRNVQLP